MREETHTEAALGAPVVPLRKSKVTYPDREHSRNAPRKLQIDHVIRSQFVHTLAHTSLFRAILPPHERLLPINDALGIHDLLLVCVRIRQVVHDDEVS